MKAFGIILAALCLWTVDSIDCPSQGTFKQILPVDSRLSGLRASPDSCQAFVASSNNIFSIDSQSGRVTWTFTPTMSSADSIVPMTGPMTMSSDASMLYALVSRSDATNCQNSCSDLIAVTSKSSKPSMTWNHSICNVGNSCSSALKGSFLVMPQSDRHDLVVHFAVNEQDGLSRLSVIDGNSGQSLNSIDVPGDLVLGSLTLHSIDTFVVGLVTSNSSERVQVWRVSQSDHTLSMLHDLTNDVTGWPMVSSLSGSGIIVQHNSNQHQLHGISVQTGHQVWQSDESVLAACVVRTSINSKVALVSSTPNANSTDSSIVVIVFDISTGRIVSQSQTVVVKGLVNLPGDSCNLMSMDDNNKLVMQFRSDYFAFTIGSSKPELVFHGDLMERNSNTVSNLLRVSSDNKQCTVLAVSEAGWVSGFAGASYPITP